MKSWRDCSAGQYLLMGELETPAEVGYKARHPRLDPECRTTVELSSIVVLVSDLISDISDI